MTATTTKDRVTGRYVDTRCDLPCRCGHTLGEHTADRAGTVQPCLHDGCACESFRRLRGAR